MPLGFDKPEFEKVFPLRGEGAERSEADEGEYRIRHFSPLISRPLAASFPPVGRSLVNVRFRFIGPLILHDSSPSF